MNCNEIRQKLYLEVKSLYQCNRLNHCSYTNSLKRVPGIIRTLPRFMFEHGEPVIIESNHDNACPSIRWNDPEFCLVVHPYRTVSVHVDMKFYFLKNNILENIAILFTKALTKDL